VELVGGFVDQLIGRYEVGTMLEHVEAIEARGGLPTVEPSFVTEGDAAAVTPR
jgi:hypothetical protein